MDHDPRPPSKSREGADHVGDDRQPDRDVAQVMELIRDVLKHHMADPDHIAAYRAAKVELIGRDTGKTITSLDIADGVDIPGAIRITMRDGRSYRLTLEEG